MEATPERAGEVLGAFLVVVAQLIGIFKCIQIMRRPTTSRLCVTALMLVLIGWLFSSLEAADRIMSGSPSGAVRLLVGTVVILLMFAALVVGIVGLSLYDRSRYVQGRSQAIWALVLSGIMVCVFVGAIFSRTLRDSDGGSGDLQLAGSRNGSSVITKPEFNFSVTPSARWVTLKPESINKVACLAMRRSKPEIFFVAIGESTAGSLDLATLAEVSKANLAGAAHVLEQKEETVALKGRTFIHVSSTARHDATNLTLNYEHWLATERGFSWQLIFWSQNADRKALSAESRAVMDTFEVLDVTRSGGGKGNLVDVSRPGLGYATKLAGMGWNAWTDPEKDNALIDFGAQRINEAFAIIPVRFESPDAPDMEALARGLLDTLDFEYPPEEEYDSKPWSPPYTGQGMELSTKREVDGTLYHYRLRVAKGAHGAHFIAGWHADGKGDAELIRKTLDAVTLQEPDGPIPPRSAEQKKAYGFLLNRAGLSYFKRKEYAESAVWLKRAFEQTSNDPDILGNVGHALEKAERYDEGRELLAPHVKRFAQNLDLGVRFARLQELSGAVDEGNATFLSLIDRGLKEEDDLLSWLNLLTADDHYTQAIRAAEAWVAKQPSVTTRRWLAQTTFHSGKEKESLMLLETLLKENPADPRVALDLGGFYNDAGEHAKAAEIAEKLLADGKESPRALEILGWSQMGRKWYRDAKVSFERAARKLPDDDDIKDAIRQASARLGQGDNSGIREPIETVAIPHSVASALAANAVPSNLGDGHSAAWLMRATGWRFEKDKPLRKTAHRRVKVLTSEGARDFSSVEVAFDPVVERIFMNRIDVKDATGAVVSKADISDAYVRDLDGGGATNRKVLHMQVPGVKPGYVVEWEVTIEDRGSSEAFEFQRHLFASSLPVTAEAVL
jgi:tetratricopeptide (TPR) repeat protein